MSKTACPRHKGVPIFGSLLELYDDPRIFFQNLYATYGGSVSFKLGNFKAMAIFDPELIGEVLVTNHQQYTKNRIFWDNVKEVFGNGLLTNEGESWRTQRKLASPSFRPKSVASYIDSIIEISEKEVKSWVNGSRVDVHKKMMSLTAEITAKIMFNTSTGEKGKRLLDALIELEHFVPLRLKRPHPILHKLPLRSNRRYKALIKIVEEEVLGFIRDAKESDSEYPTLLSNLLAMRYEDGTSMSDQQLRDEVMTMFIAGHDTTAITLSSTFYLLSQHPEVEQKMVDEIQSILGDKPLKADMLEHLVYTKNVLKEAMRLKPVVWALGREAVSDTTLGPYPVKKGTTVYMSPYIMHMLPEYFEEPDAFKPERWSEGFAKQLPKHVYAPFGGGPRTCIGEHLAQMEVLIALVTVYKNFQLVYEQSEAPEYFPAAVLTPTNGIPMALFRRT